MLLKKIFWVSMVLKAMFSLEYSDNLVLREVQALVKAGG